MSETDRYSLFKAILSERKEKDRLRTITCFRGRDDRFLIAEDGRSYLNFCGNDYLGLSTSERLSNRASQYARDYGTGSSASRLVTGSFDIHDRLEKRVSYLLNKEASLLFPSGYQANTTAIPALAGKNDLILADRHVHNSIIQGIRLSRSDFQRFRHNDTDHLARLLEKSSRNNYRNIWVITESLFSMDGDFAPLAQIGELCKSHHAFLYVDDAHALGVYGKYGMGLAQETEGVDIIVTTFGKAAGSSGAVIACDEPIKQWLINYCGGVIYTTALPPPVIGAIEAALDCIAEMGHERKVLRNHSKNLIESLGAMGYNTGRSESQIIPVILQSEKSAIDLSQKLSDNSIYVQAIRPPTVQDSRLRITVTASHTIDDIQRLIESFGTQ